MTEQVFRPYISIIVTPEKMGGVFEKYFFIFVRIKTFLFPFLQALPYLFIIEAPHQNGGELITFFYLFF